MYDPPTSERSNKQFRFYPAYVTAYDEGYLFGKTGKYAEEKANGYIGEFKEAVEYHWYCGFCDAQWS